ncbi:MAG: indolepyruvate ferredoxin oxidoreductase subunit alpha [Desulfobacterales bacterium]|nr:indolepyruvate ferredoxin oxidoreductase subunit alpha [Desulfobacterales bacterium]
MKPRLFLLIMEVCVGRKKLMLGNEAIAQGLLENGCAVATSYPGTPASEILASLARIKEKDSLPLHSQWAVNEKVAFEIAYAGCMAGLRTAVSMKQVGLNVAADPLMSAAYMGAKGGFIVISADDPGPHSSQTEQDSRLMAMMAKIPVLDPDSPAQAKEMISIAYEISETFEIPVMLRPTTRVCHSRQDIEAENFGSFERKADFKKDPARWAATPKFRFKLHTELEKKLEKIAAFKRTAPVKLNKKTVSGKAVIVSGVAAAHTREIMKDLGLWDKISVFQVVQPYPLHRNFISSVCTDYNEILIIEETMPVIEMQIADRNRVRGKLNGFVSRVGEILPEAIEQMLCDFAGLKADKITVQSQPGRRPTLCAGCPHRASFFAIKKAAPKGIYTSAIGCYTLGLNLGAVDTVLCMGAAISQAEGFHHAYKNESKRPDIVATIGDSTFFHAGIPALIDAVVQNVHFTLVILDNRTTAMTGNQPTPASGFGASGETLETVDIEALVKGCGVKFCKTGDPCKIKEFIPLVKEAVLYARDKGPAVVIARHPCLIGRKSKEKQAKKIFVEITNACEGCEYCIKHFECPAIIFDNDKKRADIDPLLCSGCGVCVHVCPKKAIVIK